MPHKPKHPCGYPGCPNLTNDRFCDVHKKKVDSTYNKYERDNFSRTFYNSPRWRELRKRKLSISPLCEECKKNGTFVKATMVDHITPIKQGGEAFDINNLQSLCWSCHSRKSVQEGSRFGRKNSQKTCD